jgi:hypothetical protein
MERHIVNASRNAVDPETTRHSMDLRNEPMSFPRFPRNCPKWRNGSSRHLQAVPVTNDCQWGVWRSNSGDPIGRKRVFTSN